jgi:hypothetical protein
MYPPPLAMTYSTVSTTTPPRAILAVSKPKNSLSAIIGGLA